MNKLKTYRMALAKVFPKSHNRAGEPTNFADKIREGEKIHTIREGFSKWESKIKKIQEGKAQLVIFEWEGKPYRSKQKDLYIITKDRIYGTSDGDYAYGKPAKIGIEKVTLQIPHLCTMHWVLNDKQEFLINNGIVSNDGFIYYDDFIEWFKPFKININREYAIIHFTDFRYNKEVEENEH